MSTPPAGAAKRPWRDRRRSLTRQLLAWALGALVLVWASFVAVGYRTGEHEADELTDGHLASAVHLLLKQHDVQFNEPPPDGIAAGRPDLRSHDYQQSLSVVIWNAQGEVLTRTGEAPLPDFDAREGFADLRLGTPPTLWRSFARWDPADHARKVMVLLSVQERDELAQDIAEQAAAPGFWLLPVVALALGWAIRRGLLPLRDLSADVAALDVHEGRPLRTKPVAEFRPVVDAINTLVTRQHAALKRERELSGELAHELRTPLASLLLHTALLRSAGDDAERAQALARIEHDAQRAHHVLNDLLALARASRTEFAEHAQPLDLVELARRVVGEHAPAALASGHELALGVLGSDPAAGFALRGHPVLLELALGNLLANALSHTPPGTLVEVQIDPQARWLQVCDNGQPAADKPVSSAGLSLGLGLGHQVVDKIAAIHHARFTAAEPPPGFSTCYRLHFAGH